MSPAGITRFCVLSKLTSAVIVSTESAPSTRAFLTGTPFRVIFSVFLVAKPILRSNFTLMVLLPYISAEFTSGDTAVNSGAPTTGILYCASVSLQAVTTSATAARDNVLIIFLSFIIRIVFCYSIVTFVQITLSPLSRNEPPHPPEVVMCS